ncbi:MAG: BON domain-containing protein [Bacteriovoracia bacterium]
MDRRDLPHRRLEGYYEGASGHHSQFEWDDEGLGETSANFYGDDARWKNDTRAIHMNNDEFGYGTRQRHWYQNLDNMKPHGEHFGKGPKGYQRSNERILEDVCEALRRHDEIDARNVEVSVDGGIVTLTGGILNRRMKKMTERIADSVIGVDDVVNLLSLEGEPKGDQISSDGSPLGGNPEQESKTGNWPP